MRKYNAYWWYMLATITCGVIFLTVKLAYEWPQKFDHFGIYIKPEALGKYEQYLGNAYAAEKGLPPRLEITGHLHNRAAQNDPNIKEYEVALDPLNADPTNPEMDRPHFWPRSATEKIATNEKEYAHGIRKHVRGYLMVGALLLVFTGLTVALSYVHFGTQKANIAVAMLVATVKAGLVAAIFMHLAAERRLIYRILIFTGFFVLG